MKISKGVQLLRISTDLRADVREFLRERMISDLGGVPRPSDESEWCLAQLKDESLPMGSFEEYTLTSVTVIVHKGVVQEIRTNNEKLNIEFIVSDEDAMEKEGWTKKQIKTEYKGICKECPVVAYL